MAAVANIQHERGVESYDWSPVAPGGAAKTGELLVRAFQVATTDLVVIEVYELGSGATGPHSTVFHHDEYGWVGKLVTRSPECDLPLGDARTARVTGHYRALKQQAYDVIRAAYPELTDALRLGGGSATVTADDFSRRVLHADVPCRYCGQVGARGQCPARGDDGDCWPDPEATS